MNTIQTVKNLHKLTPLMLCFLLIGFHILFLTPERLQRVENLFLDAFFRIRPTLNVSNDIAYIEVAEDSMQVFGRWPFQRHIHAALVHVLTTWKAKAIVFDVVFSEPSNEFDDGALEEALKETANSSTKLYLPLLLESIDGKKIWIRSLPQFEQYADGLGQIEITPDLDGLVRRIKPEMTNENKTYPHLALSISSDLLKENGEVLNIADLPHDKNGNFFINWSGEWQETFHHYSYVDVLRSFDSIQKQEKPIISPEQIENKICIIGVTAKGLTDIKAAPIASAYPAVGLYGNIINSVLNKQFIHPIPSWANILILIIWGLAASLIFNHFRNVLSFIMAIALSLGWILVSYFCFTEYGLWFYVFEQILLVFILFIFSAMYSFFFVEKERKEFYRLATHDGLTGLLTIRHFYSLLNDAIEETAKNHEKLGLILMDIDYFKKFNDVYGHQMGDEVLKTVAKIVSTCNDSMLENKDHYIAGRYGGEELVVLVKHLKDPQIIIEYAERIRTNVEKTSINFGTQRISVTLSLGVAVLNKDPSAEKIIRLADQALYHAKNLGRNRICVA